MSRSLPTIGNRWLGLGLVSGLVLMVAGAGAAAATESDTVGGFGRGLWWSLSLIMSEGFVGAAPKTTAGAFISVLMMITGFALLSVVSAALASLFVRSDERPQHERDVSADAELLTTLQAVLVRLDSLEERLDRRP